MRKAGHTGELVGIDISGMDAAEQACKGQSIRIMEADARTCFIDGTFAASSFDMILDKSTIDAMLCDAKHGMSSVRAYAGQVSSMLSAGGCFFVVSHNSPGFDEDEDGSDTGEEDEEEAPMAEWLREIVAGLTMPTTPQRPADAISNSKKRKQKQPKQLIGNSWSLDIHSSEEQKQAPSIYVFTKVRRSLRRRQNDSTDKQVVLAGTVLQIQVHEH